MSRPAVFLDRDDTLIVNRGYECRIENLQWLEGAMDALRRFHQADVPVFVVTNQGGVGLGRFSEAELQSFHKYLCAEVEARGGLITDVAYCVHHPDAVEPGLKSPCPCRKPAPGMILSLASKWQIALSDSVMIGDRESDLEAGRGAGCHSYRFDGTNVDKLACYVIQKHFSCQPRFP
jgi:D-glycero-D-manno-heptose 1,7-bisphosphate phosphatase